jgi:2-(1,2-epoxy-1,2-dihydrophenyl)acetyl-CoA isomerase
MIDSVFSSGPVLLDMEDDGVARLRLNRPEVSNAMDIPLLQALHAAIVRCYGDSGIRAVLLSGEGRHFCSGGDVRAFGAQRERLPEYIRETMAWLHGSIMALRQLPAPVVAAVGGVAAGGGGFGLICASDLVVAAESARFFGPGTGIGMTPDCGTTVTLPALVGLRKTQEIILTNPTLTAPEALEIGLITRVVPDEDLMDEALTLARQIAAGAPLANASAKHLLWRGVGASVEYQMAEEARTQVLMAETEDAKEGLASVIEKREPKFSGK